jgi:hypothetical protein
MAKDPAVLFYYEAFMVGTQFMTDDEVGKYIRLLCLQFDKGHMSKELVLTVCKANEIPMSIKSKLLIDSDGLYFNERADIEKEKRRKFVSSRKHDTSLANRTEVTSEALAKHTININRDINRDINKGTNNNFELFWNAYPRKVGKKKAQEAFKKVKIDIQLIISSIEKQKKSDQWLKDGGQYIPYPSTWLNQERWNDELTYGGNNARTNTYRGNNNDRQLDPDTAAEIDRIAESLRAK